MRHPFGILGYPQINYSLCTWLILNRAVTVKWLHRIMENQRLIKQLQDLQTQLQQAKSLEQNDREGLLQLVKDIQATLARTDKSEEYESAVQRLEDAVQRFE